jgi:hypothetical protein
VKAGPPTTPPDASESDVAGSIPAGDPVWRAAPTVLLRFRSLFVALLVGTLLVSVVATAYPLFLSASENGLLASAIDVSTVTPYGMGVAYRSTDVGFRSREPGGATLWERREEVFTAEAARSDSLMPTERAIFGGVVSLLDREGSPPATGELDGRLYAGTDAIDHVRVLAGEEGPGVWLPDLAATALEVGPGDEVTLATAAGSIQVAVDGVYAALYTQPRKGYWRLWNDAIYPCPDLECAAPPQFVITDLARMIELSRSLGFGSATFAWQAPARTDPPLTLAQAGDLATFATKLEERMGPGGDLRRLFTCCGLVNTREGSSEVTFASNAELVVRGVRQRIATVQAPMLVLLVAGLALALAVVAGAGFFAAVSRRIEMGVLTIRGWGPVPFGAKAALEALVPASIGGLAGLTITTALVSWVGPSAPVAGSARIAALVAAGAGTIASILSIAAVAATAFVARHEHRHRVTRILGAVPWELAALAVAWTMARRLEAGGLVQTGGIERPQAAAFLFPLALALGVGVLSARILRLLLRLPSRSGAAGASAMWLAVRRLRSSAALSSLFLVAGVLTLSVSTSALATVASLRSTVEAKAKVFVGSDVQVQTHRDGTVAADFPYPSTKVIRFRDAGSLDDSDAPFDMLVIDVTTFVDAAYWNDAFSDDPLPDLMQRLSRRQGPGWPVVVANGRGRVPRTISIGEQELPVSVVGTANAFPGSSSDYRPLVVIDRSMFAGALSGTPDPTAATPRALTEVWIRGSTDGVVRSLGDLGASPLLVITAEEVQDIPSIDAAVQTFLVLQVLGSSAVVLLIVVAVVYLTTRQRARIVATLLSERMGMRASTMRAATAAELGVVLLGSFLVGTVVGLFATSIVVPSLDPLPSILPDPLVALPLAAVAVTAASLVVATFAGAAAADRAAGRPSGAEVMRVAE